MSTKRAAKAVPALLNCSPGTERQAMEGEHVAVLTLMRGAVKPMTVEGIASGVSHYPEATIGIAVRQLVDLGALKKKSERGKWLYYVSDQWRKAPRRIEGVHATPAPAVVAPIAGSAPTTQRSPLYDLREHVLACAEDLDELMQCSADQAAGAVVQKSLIQAAALVRKAAIQLQPSK
jgi:hypothetical protein